MLDGGRGRPVRGRARWRRRRRWLSLGRRPPASCPLGRPARLGDGRGRPVPRRYWATSWRRACPHRLRAEGANRCEVMTLWPHPQSRHAGGTTVLGRNRQPAPSSYRAPSTGPDLPEQDLAGSKARPISYGPSGPAAPVVEVEGEPAGVLPRDLESRSLPFPGAPRRPAQSLDPGLGLSAHAAPCWADGRHHSSQASSFLAGPLPRARCATCWNEPIPFSQHLLASWGRRPLVGPSPEPGDLW